MGKRVLSDEGSDGEDAADNDGPRRLRKRTSNSYVISLFSDNPAIDCDITASKKSNKENLAEQARDLEKALRKMKKQLRQEASASEGSEGNRTPRYLPYAESVFPRLQMMMIWKARKRMDLDHSPVRYVAYLVLQDSRC